MGDGITGRGELRCEMKGRAEWACAQPLQSDPVGETDLSPVTPRIDQGWDVGAQGAEDAPRGLSPEEGDT